MGGRQSYIFIEVEGDDVAKTDEARSVAIDEGGVEAKGGAAGGEGEDEGPIGSGGEGLPEGADAIGGPGADIFGDGWVGVSLGRGHGWQSRLALVFSLQRGGDGALRKRYGVWRRNSDRKCCCSLSHKRFRWWERVITIEII